MAPDKPRLWDEAFNGWEIAFIGGKYHSQQQSSHVRQIGFQVQNFPGFFWERPIYQDVSQS